MNYNEWMNNVEDEQLYNESKLLSESEIAERFEGELSFGTAGIRGLLGSGTNRLNIYTVARVAEGLARAIIESDSKRKKMVIGYDVRHFSEDFANLTASIMSAHGIEVHLFREPIPTPIVSYAIRGLGATCGVMITASHNPKEYNGYKVYWSDGAQIANEVADEIVGHIDLVDIFSVDLNKINNELIHYINEILIEKYLSEVRDMKLSDEVDDVKIVYTPLNGTGSKFVQKTLRARGFCTSVVKEQEQPDPNFTTTPSPNPEDIESFEYAIKLGHENGADLLLATDPDADRVGVMIKHHGKYRFIGGNALGTLMVNYILSMMNEKDMLSSNSKIITTIVTDTMVNKIADKYNVEVIRTHVGFKNVYEIVEKMSDSSNFIMGYEESFGFGIGHSLARDKDAISASMIIAEMVGYYKSKGLNLIDIYHDLQKEYGYHEEEVIAITLNGVDGKSKIDSIVDFFRENDLKMDSEVLSKIDYLEDNTELSKMNVIKVEYENGVWFAIRPSGTEPKLKVYTYSSHVDKTKAMSNLKVLVDEIYSVIND